MEKVTAYKGFDKDLRCRGFQYEEGKEYEIDKKPVRCTANGFHACEAPLDVFGYYPPVDGYGNINSFHEVECSGEIDRDSSDSKIACSKIKIGAEINFLGLAKAHVEYVKSKIDKTKEQSVNVNVASNTGNYSAASNTGNCSAASNTGYRSAASNTGYRSAASNTGNSSVALAWGIDSKAKAAKGSYIALAEWKYNNSKSEWELKTAKMAKVDGVKIKADTYYKLVGGKFVEA